MNLLAKPGSRKFSYELGRSRKLRPGAGSGITENGITDMVDQMGLREGGAAERGNSLFNAEVPPWPRPRGPPNYKRGLCEFRMGVGNSA